MELLTMPRDKIPMMVDVVLEFIDQEGNTSGTEHTVTDLIMRNGARVFAKNEVPIGELLELKTPDGSFESPAVVKDVILGSDHIPRLVIEFMGSGWQNSWFYTEEQANSDEYTDPSLGRHSRPDDYYDKLLKVSSDTSMLLQIVISDLASGQSPDMVFLTELKESVDQLRAIIFRIQESTRRMEGRL